MQERQKPVRNERGELDLPLPWQPYKKIAKDLGIISTQLIDDINLLLDRNDHHIIPTAEPRPLVSHNILGISQVVAVERIELKPGGLFARAVQTEVDRGPQGFSHNTIDYVYPDGVLDEDHLAEVVHNYAPWRAEELQRPKAPGWQI